MGKVNIQIDDRLVEIEDGLCRVGSIYENSGIDAQKKELLYKGKISLSDKDSIILQGGENLSTHDKTTSGDAKKNQDKIIYKFNGSEHTLEGCRLDIETLNQADHLDSGYFYIRLNTRDIEIDKELHNKIIIYGGVQFISIPKECIDDEGYIDVEKCAKKGRCAPRVLGGKYKIRLDREIYKVSQSYLSGREILELANKDALQYELYQKSPDGTRILIKPDADVYFYKEGVERFETIPVEAQQG